MYLMNDEVFVKNSCEMNRRKSVSQTSQRKGEIVVVESANVHFPIHLSTNELDSTTIEPLGIDHYEDEDGKIGNSSPDMFLVKVCDEIYVRDISLILRRGRIIEIL